MPPADPPGLPSLRLQDLPPPLAHRCLEVERFVRETLGVALAGARVLVACSGGPDSMALLAILQALRPRGGFSLLAAHLDHGLRPDAAEDLAAVRRLCRHLKIPCISKQTDVAVLAADRRMGLEEAGRLARLEFLEAARAHHDAVWIATGHQLNDLAEDQLMRQLRGAGWPALGGMAARDDRRRLLRPLLLQPRQALEDLAATLRLPFRNDPMNADPRFLRNRIRNAILPLLLEENPSYLSQVAGLWRLARLDETHFDLAIEPLIATPQAPCEDLQLPVAVLRSMDPAVRLRCFKAALERLGAGGGQLDTLIALEAAFCAGRTGATFQFSGGGMARLERETLRFCAGCPEKTAL